MRAAILGGGGFRVPLIVREIARTGLPVDDIALYDPSPSRLAVVAAVLTQLPLGPGVCVTTTTVLDEAIAGADLCFAALRVGGLDGRVEDEREALDRGVLGQETVGAGGLASALRVVPAVDHVAERVAALAPDAWVITMTNPAGVATEAMSHRLGDRVVGVCDSPAALIHRACGALGVDPGPSLAAVTERAHVDYVGLNHLGWLRALTVDGVDRLPRLLGDPELLATVEEGRLFGPELIAALGCLPNEYLFWYYAQAESLAAVVAAGRTRGEQVRERQRAFYAAATADRGHAAQLWSAANDERNASYLAELRAGERDAADVATGGYESVAVALAQALTTGPPATLVLNVPNRDILPALPDDAVIETLCRVDDSGARPLPVAPLTLHQLGLVAAVKECERAAIEAARSGSPTAALRAFALHPLVGSAAAARQLAHRALFRSRDVSPNLHI